MKIKAFYYFFFIFSVSLLAYAGDNDFQVNTYTTGDQCRPEIAMDAKGNFVVVWDSSGQDEKNWAWFLGVFAQRFSSNGQPVGQEFQVNTFTSGHQQHQAVAMDPKGNFVIVWSSGNDHDGSYYGVFAQRYGSNGQRLGKEFRVNTYTTRNQQRPAIAMDKKGNFVVVWESDEQDGSGYGIFGQRFKKNGKKIGQEFQVNTTSYNFQQRPAVAMDPVGNFVVTWDSGPQDFLYIDSNELREMREHNGSYKRIFAQRFSSNGQPVGKEFQVNTYTKDDCLSSAIAMDKKGDFLIVWHSWGQDAPNLGVFAQKYNSNGQPVGKEFQVNKYMVSNQGYPALAMDKRGNSIITWECHLKDGYDYGIYARKYKSNGKAVGGEFQVNTYTKDSQARPAISMIKKWNPVIAWMSQGQDGDGAGIFGKVVK